MDVVMPYVPQEDNEQIIVTLISIDKYFHPNKVFMASPLIDTRLKNIEWVYCEDVYKSNKDANIIDKVIACCEHGVTGDFAFWSDDQAILKHHQMKVVFNNRNPFLWRPTCKWEERMCRTGHYILEKFGRKLPFNFESHVPQKMNRQGFLRLKNLDYQSGIGLTINTLYYGVNGWKSSDEADQRKVKATFENDSFDERELQGKLWVGWNDKGWKAGLRDWMFKKFPDKCKYEA